MVTEDYEADRDSLARHTAPAWWREARFGVLITWGPYSVPAFADRGGSFRAFSEWYWFFQQLDPSEVPLPPPGEDPELHRRHHRAVFGDATYDDLIERWDAARWDPQEWIDLIERSGAGYFVLVAKHHDGVALWPTATSGRSTAELGPRRDIVGELLRAAEGSGVRSGLFYAMAEWFTPAPHPAVMAAEDDPLFDLAFNRRRRAIDVRTGEPAGYLGYRPIDDYARDHVVPQIRELTNYSPSLLWFDLPGDADYLGADRIIADFYNSAAAGSAEVLVNDQAARGAHGDFRSLPLGARSESDDPRPFEVCRSISTSFGHVSSAADSDIASSAELIGDLVEVVSAGGNLLLNIGPRADGTIDGRERDRLLDIGRWLEVNGAAIRGSRSWDGATGDGDRFTVGEDGALFAFVLPPAEDTDAIELPVRLGAGARVTRLDAPGALDWEDVPGGTRLPIDAAGRAVIEGAPVVLRLGSAEQVRPIGPRGRER